nr:retrovirus-related Pol polyprotein from transposon TNT 1-94 [Tanacetum cinerariifolium]
MEAVEVPQTLKYRDDQLNAAPVLEVKIFTNWKKWFMCHIIDSLDDEENVRSSHEYLNDLKEEYQARALLAKSKRFFKKGTKSSPQHKPKLRPTKDCEAKYNKVKAKHALLSLSTLASKASMVKALMALAEDNDVVSKEGTINGKWVKILMKKHINTKILKENKHLRTKLKELTIITEKWLNSSNKVNQCISKQIPSQKKRILGVDQLTEDPFNSGQKYLVFVKSSSDDTKVSIPGVDGCPKLKKLDGDEPTSGPKTIKSILRSKYTFKAEALKGVTINEPSSAPAKEREINPRNPQHAFKRCEVYGSSTHTTTDHYDIEWFKRAEALQAKKVEASKSTRDESSNTNKSKTLTKRYMTGVKSYLHKYVEQPGPIMVSGDDSTCTTKGYGSIKCNGIVFTKFNEKRGTIFNSNKEVEMIALRVYFLKNKSQAPETIMSFIKRVENQNNIKVKQLRTDSGTKFKNSILVNFCDEKGVSQNFYSPYTPKENGVAVRKNRTLIEAARTMLSGSVFFKQYWTKAVATVCYTQNKSTIAKRHRKTSYEIFRKRILNINFIYVFGCLVYIHNHKDQLGKFDEKANDGYLLGYSLVYKAFRVFNTRR